MDQDELAVLLSKLRDSDEYKRQLTVEALVRLGAPAVEPLLAKLSDSDWYVLQLATEALVRLGAPAVEPLFALVHDSDGDVRWAAVEALGQLGDVRAVEPLLATLRDRPRFTTISKGSMWSSRLSSAATWPDRCCPAGSSAR